MIWLATASRFAFANWKLLVVALVVLGAVWWFRHTVNEADASGFARGYELAKAEDAAAAQKVRDETQAKIIHVDTIRTAEREKANAELEALRSDLRSARVRLSIRTVPAAPAPGQPARDPGVGDDAPRADIDPRDAEAIIAITGRGDDAIRQLTAAQDIIRALTAPPAP